MSKIDKIIGMDDEETPRQKRAPVWQRAVWHALKTLVRRHPGAALSAAGSGVGYAVKTGAAETVEAVGEATGLAGPCETAPVPDVLELTDRQKKELLTSLTSEQRAEFAKLAND